jgi:hypothetical protein
MTGKAVKSIVLCLLFLLSAVILWWGIRQYRLFWEWLEPRRIEGLGLVVVGSFGLTALFIPYVVTQNWADFSATEVAAYYLHSFGLMFVVLTAVFLLFWLMGFILYLLKLYPVILFTLVALILLLPLLIRKIQRYL